MNDTCATHRSRVPRRSSGRNKRRSDNSGRRERTRPGVLVCALCAAVGREGLPRLICLFIYLLLNMLNVRRFPPPSSRIYQLCYINKLTNAIIEKSRRWHTDKRNFKKVWQDEFLFTEVKSKAVCLVCKQSVAVLKEYNIRRHYETKHSAAFSKYNGEERKKEG